MPRSNNPEHDPLPSPKGEPRPDIRHTAWSGLSYWLCTHVSASRAPRHPPPPLRGPCHPPGFAIRAYASHPGAARQIPTPSIGILSLSGLRHGSGIPIGVGRGASTAPYPPRSSLAPEGGAFPSHRPACPPPVPWNSPLIRGTVPRPRIFRPRSGLGTPEHIGSGGLSSHTLPALCAVDTLNRLKHSPETSPTLYNMTGRGRFRPLSVTFLRDFSMSYASKTSARSQRSISSRSRK